MRDRDLYAAVLGLTAPWHVVCVELDTAAELVRVHVATAKGTAFGCPTCVAPCPRHDHRTREWRHLDTCQFQTILVADIPRVRCREHGVRQIQVPWAEPGSRFTALFEAIVIDWLREASMAAVARRMRLSWDAIDGIMSRAVARGLARRGEFAPRAICVDETSFQKRHEYVTVVTDLDKSIVLYVADDHKTASLDGYYETLTEENREAIEVVAMDMWGPYIASTRWYVPDPDMKICFDRFHVSKLLGDAVDKTRREENRELRKVGDTSLTGTKHILLKRGNTLGSVGKIVVDVLRQLGLKTARAWAIKEAATKLWQYVRRGWAEKAWAAWLGWAQRSRIDAVKKAARTIRDHLWGILNAIIHGATNAKAESINSKIQRVKKAACGFRNRERFRNAILFHLGGLDLYPTAATHTNS